MFVRQLNTCLLFCAIGVISGILESEGEHGQIAYVNKYQKIEAILKTFERNFSETANEFEKMNNLWFTEYTTLTCIAYNDNFIPYDENEVDLMEVRRLVRYFSSAASQAPTKTKAFAHAYTRYLSFWAMLNFRTCMLYHEYAIEEQSEANDSRITECRNIGYYMMLFNKLLDTPRAFDEENAENLEDILYRPTTTKTPVEEIAIQFVFLTTVTDYLRSLNGSVNLQPENPYVVDVYETATDQKEGEPPIVREKDSKDVNDVRRSYYYDAWIIALKLYGEDLIKMENFFNDVLNYDIRIEQMENLVPSYEESLYIWEHIDDLSKIMNRRTGGCLVCEILLELENLKLKARNMSLPDSANKKFRVVLENRDSTNFKIEI